MTSATRTDLQRVATHVLARKRFAATGRFGLRTGPGGIATPMFGDGEVLRTSGGVLIHETGSDVHTLDLDGSSLAVVAAWAGTTLTDDFSVGADTPPVSDPRAPLQIDHDEATSLGEWFTFGWQVLDDVSQEASGATTIQLWPEHFDAGSNVLAGEQRVNLGVSPGDGFSDEPYLYVGPWSDARPGSAGYWNAPFGAVLTRSAATAETARDFVREGLDRLRTL